MTNSSLYMMKGLRSFGCFRRSSWSSVNPSSRRETTCHAYGGVHTEARAEVSREQTLAVISAYDRREALILLRSGQEIAKRVNIGFTSCNPQHDIKNLHHSLRSEFDLGCNDIYSDMLNNPCYLFCFPHAKVMSLHILINKSIK